MRALRHLSIGIAVLAAFGAVAALALPRRGYAYEYVQNGGFEDGAGGWTLISSGSTLDTEPDGVAPYSGSGRGRITLAQSSFTLLQTTQVGVPEGDYAFSVRIRSDSPALVMYALVAGGSPVTTYWRDDKSNAMGEWWSFSATVRVTGFNVVTFRVGGAAATGDRIYVDDMRFEGAAPATMTPTDTPLPPTATDTPLPPTATKTPQPTRTPEGAEPTPTPGATDASPVALAEGALLNGGFEEVDSSGGPAGWSKYGGTLVSDEGVVLSGARAARLDSATESTKWVYQTVLVQEGGAYAFEAWLRAGAGLNGAWLRVSWYASADGSGAAIGASDSTTQLDPGSTEWQRLTTGSVLAPPGAASAKLRAVLQPASSAPASLAVDDASFGPAAPPDPGATEEQAPPEAAAGPSSSRASSPGARGASRATRPPDTAASEPPPIVINEVLYDGMSTPDGVDVEWVELYNASGEPVSLAGWFLADDVSAEPLADLTVPARGFTIITSAAALPALTNVTAPIALVEGRIGNSLGNGGDVLALVDPAGRFVDAVSWGSNSAAMRPPVPDVPAGHSIERQAPGADTDRAGDFIDNERPSPGAPYALVVSQPDAGIEGPAPILREGSAVRLDWLPWLLAAGASGALAVVAASRAWSMLAGRWRHS
jgi:hypothetical protein